MSSRRKDIAMSRIKKKSKKDASHSPAKLQGTHEASKKHQN